MESGVLRKNNSYFTYTIMSSTFLLALKRNLEVLLNKSMETSVRCAAADAEQAECWRLPGRGWRTEEGTSRRSRTDAQRSGG